MTIHKYKIAHRKHEDIERQILNILQHKPLAITHIVNYLETNHSQAKQSVRRLIENGMIEVESGQLNDNVRSVFTITSNGVKYLHRMNELERFIKW